MVSSNTNAFSALFARFIDTPVLFTLFGSLCCRANTFFKRVLVVFLLTHSFCFFGLWYYKNSFFLCVSRPSKNSGCAFLGLTQIVAPRSPVRRSPYIFTAGDGEPPARIQTPPSGGGAARRRPPWRCFAASTARADPTEFKKKAFIIARASSRPGKISTRICQDLCPCAPSWAK